MKLTTTDKRGSASSFPKQRRARRFLMQICVGVILAFGPSLLAEVVMLRSGAPDPLSGGTYNGASDTMLASNCPTINYGSRPNPEVGPCGSIRDHALIRFDVSHFSDPNVITSATLRLTFTSGSVGVGPTAYTNALQIYALTPANAAWISGTQNGNIAKDSSSTWNYMNQTSATTGTAWAGSGGASSAGTDYSGTLLGSYTFNNTQATHTGSIDLTIPADVIQSWITGTNAGLYLRTSIDSTTTVDERIEFSSCEASTIASRPTLFITYNAPRATAIIQNGARAPTTGEIYNGASDTMLASNCPTLNYGSRPNIEIGPCGTIHDYGLIRFDLSEFAISPDSITSGTLHLTFTSGSVGVGTMAYTNTLQIYALNEANAGWISGTQNGIIATNKSSTWNYLNQTSSTSGTAWAGSSGASTAGIDYSATLLGSYTFSNTQTSHTGCIDLAVPASVIQTWMTGTNAGLYLKTSTDSTTNVDQRIEFNSCEASTIANRPALFITYDTPIITATPTVRPNFGVYKPGEAVNYRLSASGVTAGQTLAITITDAEDIIVATQAIQITSGPTWSGTCVAYNGKLGFYRLYGELPDGTLMTPSFVSSPLSINATYAGPLPGDYVTYAIVPDPATRPATLPEDQCFFGMRGANVFPSISTDLYAFLGTRWLTESAWSWKAMEPTPNQRNTFVANPPPPVTWATNGAGGSWTLYTLPNLTASGRPYGGTPDVYLPGTFAEYTGALDPTYYSDWQIYGTHVAQNWPTVYPSRTKRYYEATWEPVPTWGYIGTPAQLVILYQLAYTAMHGADPSAMIMGPCMCIDTPASLAAQYADFDAGLGAYLDAFSSHPYMENDAGWNAGFFEPEMAGQPANIATMKRRLRAYKGGIDLPMFGTEQGWRSQQSIGTNALAANEINQARRMVRGNLILLGEGWKGNIAFMFSDFPFNDNGQRYWEWGLFYNLDPASYGGFAPSKVMPKPIAASYAAMTSLVEGRRSVNNVNWLGDSVRGYVFENYGNPTDDLLVLWDFASNHAQTIPVGVSSVDVYDWMGNKTTVATSGSNLVINLSKEPVYIKGVSSSIWGSSRRLQNVALNKTATTSGDFSSSTSGSLAIDGDCWSPESRWVSSSDSNAKWIQVDLGATYPISEIRFFTGNYAPGPNGTNSNFYNTPLPSYRLQYWNGASWIDIMQRTGNSHPVIDECFAAVMTSQIRLYIDAGSVSQVMLYEIQVLSQ